MIQLSQIINSIIHLLRRFKLASILHFAGQCIALMCFFTFFTKVEENVNYNTCFDGWQKMYRAEIEGPVFTDDSIHFTVLSLPTKFILDTLKHVDKYAFIQKQYTMPWSATHIDSTGVEHTCLTNIHSSCAEMLSFFNIKMLYSTPKHNDGDVIVPLSFARNLYGKDNVVGDSIKWNEGGEYKFCIAGVYQDFPKNCCVPNDVYFYGLNGHTQNPGNMSYYTYIQLDDTINRHQVEKELAKAIRNMLLPILGNYPKEDMRIILHPLYDTYFSNTDKALDNGNWNIVFILFAFSLIIITITSINNKNFALALLPIRIKNINTRKVLGASRMSLIIQILAESLITGLLAYLTAMTLTFVLDTVIDGDISPLNHIRMSLYTLLTAVILSTVPYIFPAIIITSYPTSMALKGAYGLSKRGRRMRVLRVGMQFINCAVALTCSASFMLQKHFVLTTDYGFDKDNILFAYIHSNTAHDNIGKLRDAIKKLDNVESVSLSFSELVTQKNLLGWACTTPDRKQECLFSVIPVDKNYMRTMGIPLIDSIDIANNTTGGYIFNEAVHKKYPWIKKGTALLPEQGMDSDAYRVLGFCKDVTFNSLNTASDDFIIAFLIEGPEEFNAYLQKRNDVINIRLSDKANMNKVQNEIEKVYGQINPNEKLQLEMSSLNESLKGLYDKDIIFYNQINIIALVYIITTLIGIFCLTLFDSEHMRKETGIRKVFGASTTEILLMFTKKYMITLAVCFILSIPISHYIIQIVLSNYTVQSPYLWVAYPFALAVLFITVWLTITTQTWFNANEKPIKSLKTE